MTVFLNRFGTLTRLAEGTTIIGRDPACEITLHDGAVSRRHLRVEVDAQDRVFVEEMGSTNGTLLNGRPLPLLKRREVCAGDQLQVGLALLVVQLEGAGELELELEPPRVREPRRSTPAHFTTLLTCSECWSEIPAGLEGCPNCEPAVVKADQASDADRRRMPRVPVQIPVIYISGEQSFRGVARDLGLGGVFVASNRWDPEVTSCQLTLFPGGDQTFSISGVVRHTGSYDPETRRLPGLGIKFTEVPDDAMSWLQDTVEDESAEFFEPSSTG